MKFYLLCVASFLTTSIGLAQPTVPGRELHIQRKQPQNPAEAELYNEATSIAQAQGTVSTTSPNTVRVYDWSKDANKWIVPPVESKYIRDDKGREIQIIEVDSATAQPKVRASYSYSVDRLLASTLREIWTGTAWKNTTRETYSYDSRGRMTERLGQEWINNTWQNKERAVNVYDTQENLASFFSQRWDGSGWVTISGITTEFTYNANGKIAVRAPKQWQPSTQSYMPIGRSSYKYNAAGGITEEVNDAWVTPLNIFMPSSRNLYTIEGAQPWSEYISQTWQNGRYVNASRTTNTMRDMQGRLAYYEMQYWNTTTAAWQASYRTTSKYQANGSYESLQERFIDGKWSNDRRNTAIYNDHKELIEAKYEIGENGQLRIDTGTIVTITYDAVGNARRKVYQVWRQGDTKYNYINLVTYSDYQTITLANQQAVALTATTQIYPNPTIDKATLQLASLPQGQGALQAQLLNALGQVVKQFTLKPQQGSINQELDLSKLKAGVYTLRIQTSEGAIVKQIVRQ